MIITQKYALIGKNNQTQPILKKLTLDTLELTDVTFPYLDHWF